jgi:hypothetical protein
MAPETVWRFQEVIDALEADEHVSVAVFDSAVGAASQETTNSTMKAPTTASNRIQWRFPWRSIRYSCRACNGHG